MPQPLVIRAALCPQVKGISSKAQSRISERLQSRDQPETGHFIFLVAKYGTIKIGVVYHLQKKSGNFGWNVNGKTNLVFPNGKFPGKTGFLER